MEELKEQNKKKRKESELSTIRSQIKGYETRLKYSITDRDNTVSNLHECLLIVARNLECTCWLDYSYWVERINNTQ